MHVLAMCLVIVKTNATRCIRWNWRNKLHGVYIFVVHHLKLNHSRNSKKQRTKIVPSF